ncbi:unnamed protein product, partial [Symbiodinium sp. KB8]
MAYPGFQGADTTSSAYNYPSTDFSAPVQGVFQSDDAAGPGDSSLAEAAGHQHDPAAQSGEEQPPEEEGAEPVVIWNGELQFKVKKSFNRKAWEVRDVFLYEDPPLMLYGSIDADSFETLVGPDHCFAVTAAPPGKNYGLYAEVTALAQPGEVVLRMRATEQSTLQSFVQQAVFTFGDVRQDTGEVSVPGEEAGVPTLAPVAEAEAVGDAAG